MLYAIVTVIALIFDQLLKYWTTVHIVENTGQGKLIPGVIHLANIHNTGAAYSFLHGVSWARWFFVLVCLVFVAVVIVALARNLIATPGARWAAVFVMAGAAGNCIDRLVTGYVVDMLEFEFIRFPVFNLADICITLGAIAFCICYLVEKPKPEGEAPAETQPPAANGGDVGPELLTRETVQKRKRAEVVPFPGVPAQETAPPTAERKVTYTRPAQSEPAPAAQEAQKQAPKQPPKQPPQQQKKAGSSASMAAERITALERGTGSAKTEQVMRTLIHGNRPGEDQKPAAPVPDTASGDPYDLESILSEFRDA